MVFLVFDADVKGPAPKSRYEPAIHFGVLRYASVAPPNNHFEDRAQQCPLFVMPHPLMPER